VKLPACGMVDMDESQRNPIGNDRSVHRADFIKRFFSVAVSVGFASSVARFQFIQDARMPSSVEFHRMALLLFGMSIIVGSWDFYFTSLTIVPLRDLSRFVLDISIVSLYLVLLASSNHIESFFLCVTVIMFFYVIWDVLSIRAYPQIYALSNFTATGTVKTFMAGIWTEDGRKGLGNLTPYISMWWLIVFMALTCNVFAYQRSFYFSVLIGCAIYISYRLDQRAHWRLSKRIFFSSFVLVLLYVSQFIEFLQE
jgi:hypothetical protein